MRYGFQSYTNTAERGFGNPRQYDDRRQGSGRDRRQQQQGFGGQSTTPGSSSDGLDELFPGEGDRYGLDRARERLLDQPNLNLGSLGARGQLAGAFPEFQALMEEFGIPYGPAIPLTYNEDFVNRLQGGIYDELADNARQTRNVSTARLSSAGLLQSGTRLGYERDFANDLARNQFELDRDLELEASISNRAQQLEALAAIMASAGQSQQAAVLQEQARSLREQTRASSTARGLAPYQLVVEGLGALAQGAGSYYGSRPRGGT